MVILMCGTSAEDVQQAVKKFRIQLRRSLRTGCNDLEAICMEVTVNMVEGQTKAERWTERQADTGEDKVGEAVNREIETQRMRKSRQGQTEGD